MERSQARERPGDGTARHEEAESNDDCEEAVLRIWIHSGTAGTAAVGEPERDRPGTQRAAERGGGRERGAVDRVHPLQDHAEPAVAAWLPAERGYARRGNAEAR